MHITRIELEDIKSHREATFEFQRGTTAITGANGAGKTTIIEAVAWTLFDLLDYKKDDFVRRGAKKGAARVTFESGLDEREYTVYRDTGTGYYVFDPQLKMRIAEKKEEVARFLWQHLGVEAGTDLEALFRRAIGVPQGTFTAIFLETPTERKKAFDKLLKVEEYRQGAEKLRETSRFIEQKITTVREKIARAEGELARFDLVETELKTFQAQSEEFSKMLEAIEREVAEKTQNVNKFEVIEAQVNELKTAFEKLFAEKAKTEILLAQKESEFKQAQAAAEKIKAVESDYNLHLKALGMLKELERERVERDKLNAEKMKVENALLNVKADQKRFLDDLEKAQKAHQEIELLKPKAAEQEMLEKLRDSLKTNLASARARHDQIKSLEDKIARLRESYKANQAQIKDAGSKAELAAEFDNLQRRDSDLTREITRLRAKLEHDEQFQREVKSGLCPILSQKCLNLKPGETLEGFLKSQFVELKSQIGTFEAEQKRLAPQLKLSREADKFSATLSTLKNREAEIREEGTRLSQEKETLEKDAIDKLTTETDLAEAEAKLKSLDDPKTKIRLFEAEAANEIFLREKLSEVEKNLERLNSDRLIADDKLEVYKALDANWREFSGERDRTATAHREFLANENIAHALPGRETEFAKANEELKVLTENLTKAETEFQAANDTYDRTAHQTEKIALLEAEKRLTETRANLANARRRAEESQKELDRLAEIRRAMQGEFQEKERLEKIAETTEFIRETLKKSAPLVAKNYIYYVSLEASQMFREITGNAERTLKWTEDYGIMLEENGYERPFVNLSGGEQMAAALSVRLALLKQLSDVRLAFFDEPTTNMDAARRERLAEQISHITERRTFDQLFVISHDDTFAGFTDYEVLVGGNGND